MPAEYEFSLGPEAAAYAAEILHETDESRKDSIQKIRRWLLEENPKLHARTEDASILPFLRGCKFDVDRTKEKIANYYIMRSQVPEWFRNRDPGLPIVQELVKLGVFVPLRKLYKNRMVVVIRTGAHNPRKHSQNDVFKVGKMILDVASKECEQAQIYGIAAVFDMSNVTLGHALQLKPALIKKAVHAWQNYHVSPKQLEFINAPVYINVVLNVFKSFMSEKLQSRIRIHFGGLGNLHEMIDKEVLPVEYGGTCGNLGELCEYWAGRLMDYKEWFRADERFRADVS